jgi:hypothetical protein
MQEATTGTTPHHSQATTEPVQSIAAAAASTATAPFPLRVQHADAVREIEAQRGQTGQLTTGINARVGESIFEAGELALAASTTEETGNSGNPSQFVVAAPPGTGKTSHAIALMAATVRTASADPSKPYGCLFVVDQIKKADDIWRQINQLMPGEVAVWTSDHDVDCRKPEKVTPAKQYRVDDLEDHAIAVVTQAFLRGPRGDKGRWVNRNGHKVPRTLTIFDEQTKEVEVYDVQYGDVIKVKEAIERRREWVGTIIPQMDPLINFMHAKSRRRSPDDPPALTIETPADDPESWRVARDLQWFTTEMAEQYVRSNAAEISKLEEVFGCAAQMARNCAFIYRRGGGENGTYFLGYVPATTPDGSSIVLDATADIDGVTELCGWRKHVAVPRVRYDNLHIIHAEPYQRCNLSELMGKEQERRRYADHAKHLICEIMPPDTRGLVVCNKRLVDFGLIGLPGRSTFTDSSKYPWTLKGRQLAVTYWGGHGIGANDWKDAEFVFEFGEHFLPRRALIGMVQGLSRATATEGILTPATRDHSRTAVDAMGEGHLLRMMKQLGMRGRARSFDTHGICGPQVLVLTCEFKRLLVNAHKLFPGATLSKWGRTPDHFREKEIKQPEMLLEILTDPDLPETIPGEHVAERMGFTGWREVSTNAMTDAVKAALGNIGWSYVSKKGRGGGSWFVKTEDAAPLRPQKWPQRPQEKAGTRRRH